MVMVHLLVKMVTLLLLQHYPRKNLREYHHPHHHAQEHCLIVFFAIFVTVLIWGILMGIAIQTDYLKKDEIQNYLNNTLNYLPDLSGIIAPVAPGYLEPTLDMKKLLDELKKEIEKKIRRK
jgi:hypothetical protein